PVSAKWEERGDRGLRDLVVQLYQAALLVEERKVDHVRDCSPRERAKSTNDVGISAQGCSVPLVSVQLRPLTAPRTPTVTTAEPRTLCLRIAPRRQQRAGTVPVWVGYSRAFRGSFGMD